jgi:glycosyltransferase involved in cell wall biosynthesis
VDWSIVSRHLPEEEGTASGRALWALCRGLLADGHTVDVCSWWPTRPEGDLPPWCRWQPVPPEPWLATKARALARPRWDVARIDWEPRPGAVAVADDSLSYPAVAGARPSVLTQHFLTGLDAAAVSGGRLSARDRQDIRAQRRNARRADVVLAYSERVAGALGGGAVPVPIAYQPALRPVDPVYAPVAALVANWDWPPNRAALDRLLRAWPEVRDRVPTARLLLAGRHFELARVGHLPGVEALGPVASSTEVLARASVLAFPCPASSGPKVKVLEALGLGLAVVTTPAGAEGVMAQAGTDLVVTPPDRFPAALAEVLADPGRRRALGAAGRRAVLDHHAPLPAARVRVAAVAAGTGMAEAGVAGPGMAGPGMAGTGVATTPTGRP